MHVRFGDLLNRIYQYVLRVSKALNLSLIHMEIDYRSRGADEQISYRGVMSFKLKFSLRNFFVRHLRLVDSYAVPV